MVPQAPTNELAKFQTIMRDGVTVASACERCQKGGRVCKIDLGVQQNCGWCYKEHRECTKKGWMPVAQPVAAAQNDGGEEGDVDEEMNEAGDDGMLRRNRSCEKLY